MNSLSLGIPGVGGVSPGTHFCGLYSGPAERDRLLFPFLEEGLRHGDKCLCLIDDGEPSLIRDLAVGLPARGYSRRSTQLDVERSSDACRSAGEFSVAAMLRFLSLSVDSAVGDDFDLLRAVGEMSWLKLKPGAPGWDDLLRYESALNHLVEQAPAILMCLYDLKKLDAAMLVEVLHTHPMVLLDGAVTENPHYMDPTQCLLPDCAAAPSRYPLVKVGAEGNRGTDHLWASLTAAELRVASRISQGTTNRRIAEELSVSRHTVDAHLKHIYLKLEIHSRVELTVLAVQHRLPTG